MQGVEFHGFAGDCTIDGRITMFGERLTDFLNGQERFHLHKVEFHSLEDGHPVAMDSISLERDDLLAVVGTGPRGDEKRRVRLAETRMQLSIGPYIILGRLHAKPGLDPIKSVLQREPMIPLTGRHDGLQRRRQRRGARRRDAHREPFQVDWITATAEEATLFPEATVRSPFSMSLKKDFSGPATL